MSLSQLLIKNPYGQKEEVMKTIREGQTVRVAGRPWGYKLKFCWTPFLEQLPYDGSEEAVDHTIQPLTQVFAVTRQGRSIPIIVGDHPTDNSAPVCWHHHNGRGWEMPSLKDCY